MSISYTRTRLALAWLLGCGQGMTSLSTELPGPSPVLSPHPGYLQPCGTPWVPDPSPACMGPLWAGTLLTSLGANSSQISVLGGRFFTTLVTWSPPKR